MNLGLRCAQEEVLKIMYQHGISTTEIANYLGCTIQTLSYQLNIAKKFDSDMERMIYKYFAKKGITLNHPGETMLISKQILEHTSLTNQMLAMLITNIQSAIEDGKLSEDERTRILAKIDYFETEVSSSLASLRSLVKGKSDRFNSETVSNKVYSMVR